MIIQNVFAEYSALWVLLIVFIIAFAGIKKLAIPGGNGVHAVLSLLIAFIFISSTSTTSYFVKILPLLTLIFLLTLVITLILVFVVFKDAPFNKILAWAAFIFAILVTFSIAFQDFPTLNGMLPHSDSSGLDPNMQELKDQIYSDDFQESIIVIICVAIVLFIAIRGK